MQGPNPFIELVPVEQASGARKALYDDLERVRGKGRVSNLFKAYAAFPELGMANFKRLGVLLGQGTLSVLLKEAVMTGLAVINHCDYCVSFHGSQMQSLGAGDEATEETSQCNADTPGPHTVRFEVDTDEDVTELDEENNFICVLSEGDMMAMVLPEMSEVMERGGNFRDSYGILAEKGARLANEAIDTHLIADPLTLDPNDEILKAASTMAMKKMRRLPVVKNGKLVGMVSRGDICKAVLKG